MDTTTLHDHIAQPGWGLPQDRAAQMAARQAFVAMKRLFMDAVAPLGDNKGEWLRQQVRLASDPIDLWVLRGPVIAAMRVDDQNTRALRAQLYRGLDTIFPEAFGLDSPPTRPPHLDVLGAWHPAVGRLPTAA